MQTIADRLNFALASLKVSPYELAKKIDTSTQNIQRICKGLIKRPETICDVAHALGISAEWLALGLGQMYPIENTHKRIPRLTFKQLKEYAKDLSQDLTLENNTDFTVITSAHLSSRCFAFYLLDKSMAPRFDEKTEVIIDVDKKPQHLEFVLAYLAKLDEIIFRQVIKLDEQITLEPLNSALYRSTILNASDYIIGTLVEARLHL